MNADIAPAPAPMSHSTAYGRVEALLCAARVARESSGLHNMEGSAFMWRNETGGKARLLVARDLRLKGTITGTGNDAEIDADWSEEALAPFVAALAQAFPATLGRIAHRQDVDRFGNAVSLVNLPGGRTLRMVHHAGRSTRFGRMTIYRGRGVFIRVKTDAPDNDCCEQSVDVAGWKASWGDGELLHVEQRDGGPDLSEAMNRHLRHQSFSDAILLVVGAIIDRDDLWDVKEVQPRIAA